MTATVDHLEPRCNGGSNAMDNLVTACQTCNALKAGTAHQTLAEARDLVLERRSALVSETLLNLATVKAELRTELIPDGNTEAALRFGLLSTMAKFTRTTRRLVGNLEGVLSQVADVEKALDVSASNHNPNAEYGAEIDQ